MNEQMKSRRGQALDGWMNKIAFRSDGHIGGPQTLLNAWHKVFRTEAAHSKLQYISAFITNVKTPSSMGTTLPHSHRGQKKAPNSALRVRRKCRIRRVEGPSLRISEGQEAPGLAVGMDRLCEVSSPSLACPFWGSHNSPGFWLWIFTYSSVIYFSQVQYSLPSNCSLPGTF
jgi:hypothetical protein